MSDDKPSPEQEPWRDSMVPAQSYAAAQSSLGPVPGSARSTDEELDYYAKNCTDRELWVAIHNHFNNMGVPLSEDDVRRTPLHRLMPQLPPLCDKLGITRKWVPLFERAFRYVQNRN